MKKFTGLTLNTPANVAYVEANILCVTRDLVFAVTDIGTGKKAAPKLVTYPRSEVHHYGDTGEEGYAQWLLVGGTVNGKLKKEAVEGEFSIKDLGNGYLEIVMLEDKLTYICHAASISISMDPPAKAKPFTLAGGVASALTEAQAPAEEEEEEEEEAKPAKKIGGKAKAKAAEPEEEEEEEEAAKPAKASKSKKAAPEPEPEEEEEEAEEEADAEGDGEDEVTQEDIDDLDTADKKSLVAAYNDLTEDEDEHIALKSLKNIAKLNGETLTQAYDELFGGGVVQEDIDGLDTKQKKALVAAYNEHEDVEDEISTKDLKDIQELDLDVLDEVYEDLFGEEEAGEEEEEAEEEAEEEVEEEEEGDEPADGDDSDDWE